LAEKHVFLSVWLKNGFCVKVRQTSYP